MEYSVTIQYNVHYVTRSGLLASDVSEVSVFLMLEC